MSIASVLRDAGYVTFVSGKWHAGGRPMERGFDHFFGYICQRQAHTYYPNHLWRDGEVFRIEENEDPVYGEGFRMMKDLAEDLEAALAYKLSEEHERCVVRVGNGAATIAQFLQERDEQGELFRPSC